MPPSTSTSNQTNIESMWATALDRYKEATGIDLCVASLELLPAQIEKNSDEFEEFRNRGRQWSEALNPVLDIALDVSAAVSDAAGDAFPPAKIIAKALSLLVKAARDVKAQNEAVLSLFELFQPFSSRLRRFAKEKIGDIFREMLIRHLCLVLEFIGEVQKLLKEGKIKQFFKVLGGRGKQFADILDKLEQLSEQEDQEVRCAIFSVVHEQLRKMDELLKSDKNHEKVLTQHTSMLKEIQSGLQSSNSVSEENEKKLREISQTIGTIEEEFHEFAENEAMHKILRWLAPIEEVNKSIEHVYSRDVYEVGTGDWLFEREDFLAWKAVGTDFCWIHGIPGAGKTILCSTVIDHLREEQQRDSSIAVAYFYFTFRDGRKQELVTFLRSIVAQFYGRKKQPSKCWDLL